MNSPTRPVIPFASTVLRPAASFALRLTLPATMTLRRQIALLLTPALRYGGCCNSAAYRGLPAFALLSMAGSAGALIMSGLAREVTHHSVAIPDYVIQSLEG